MARPVGSVAAFRKVRRDYRFGPQTIQHIADGLAMAGGALTETAFVERAIAHYATFLAGHPEQLAPLTGGSGAVQAHARLLPDDKRPTQHIAQHAAAIEQLRAQLQAAEQERDRLQEHNRALQQQLRLARAASHLREHELNQVKAAAKTPAQARRLDPSKAYQIKIRHDPRTPCPALPEGFAYEESAPCVASGERRGSAYPVKADVVHTVLTRHWPIARMRQEVERLKQAPGVTKIWIAKNGVAVTTGSGRKSDSWVKENGRWIRE